MDFEMGRAGFFMVTFLIVGGISVFPQKSRRLTGYLSPKTTTLSTIRSNPEAFKNVWVKFKIQYGGLSRIYNPFFTRFVPTDYVCFSAWGDEQEIWKKEEFRNDYHFLFVDKRSETALVLYHMKKFQRAEVVGYVRNTFHGTAWIEIMHISVLPETLDEATLFHLVRGKSLMREGKWKLAIGELKKASLKESVPGRIKGIIWTDIATCYTRRGSFPEARNALETAMRFTPKSKETKALAEILEKKPIEGIDKSLKIAGLKKWEVPLWQDVEEKPVKTRKSLKKRKPVRITTPPGRSEIHRAEPPGSGGGK